MSYILKAENASDTSTPRLSHTVSDISVTKRQTCSQKPHTYYHLALKSQATDGSLPLSTLSATSDTWVLANTTAKQLDFDDSDVESVELGGLYSPSSQYDDDHTLTDELKTAFDLSETHEKAHLLVEKLGALLSEPTASSAIALGGDSLTLTPPSYTGKTTGLPADGLPGKPPSRRRLTRQTSWRFSVSKSRHQHRCRHRVER